MDRAEVEEVQRARIHRAMAEAMQVKGYVGTSVADVLAGAGVSRETFYRLYTSKLDCFLATFDAVAAALTERLTSTLGAPGAPGDPLDRFGRALDVYLDTLAGAPASARLFLIEVHAAGPEAMRRRLTLQQTFVAAIADLLGARTEADRFSCQVLVAAISSMVTGAIVDGDADALRRLGPPLVEHARRMLGSIA